MRLRHDARYVVMFVLRMAGDRRAGNVSGIRRGKDGRFFGSVANRRHKVTTIVFRVCATFS